MPIELIEELIIRKRYECYDINLYVKLEVNKILEFILTIKYIPTLFRTVLTIQLF